MKKTLIGHFRVAMQMKLIKVARLDFFRGIPPKFEH